MAALAGGAPTARTRARSTTFAGPTGGRHRRPRLKDRAPWRGAQLEGKVGLLLLGVLMAALAVAI
ncbi:MAG TPA: hypothetical protein VMT79_03900 [Candidatus Binatia bacterium]|nr:hypothetical protein [Candidatus Binatia bacterium]